MKSIFQSNLFLVHVITGGHGDALSYQYRLLKCHGYYVSDMPSCHMVPVYVLYRSALVSTHKSSTSFP